MTDTEGGRGRGWDRLTGTEGRRGDRQRVTETQGERGRGGDRQREETTVLSLVADSGFLCFQGEAGKQQCCIFYLKAHRVLAMSGEGWVKYGSSDSVAAL